jgi:glycosyltransferase involved in cell wall biosynthesis
MTQGPGESQTRWTDIEIVVPAYGESPLLAETLRSLVDVVPVDVDITVQDDASPGPHVRDIAADFAPRVAYRRTGRNLGVSGAFNEAARLSRSAFLVLVGPDDRGVPGMIEAYRRGIALHPEAAAFHPGVRVIDEGGEVVRPLGDRVKSVLRPRRHGVLAGEGLATRLLTGNWTYNPAIAWRSSFVVAHPFDDTLHTAMDLDLLLRLAFSGASLALLDDVALEYRRHGGAVSSINAGTKRLAEELDIHRRAGRVARSLGWSRAAAAASLAPAARLHGLLLARGLRAGERRDLLELAVSRDSRRDAPSGG